MPGEPLIAFDDAIYGTSPAYSSSFLDVALAELESYSLQVVVDTFSENTLTVQLQTSADGRQWIDKNPGVPEVVGSFAEDVTASFYGGDVGARPALALVRLKLTLSASGGARVRVYVRQGPDYGFTPLVIGPRLWLRADLGLTLDANSEVAKWQDMTLNGFDAVQASTNRRPRVATQTEQVGLRPALVFSAASVGSEKVLNLPSLASLTEGHVFLVFRRSIQTPISSRRAGFWRLGTSGLICHVPYTDDDIYDDTGSTSRRSLGAAPVLTADAQCLEIRSASSLWSAHLNGQSQGGAFGTNTVGFSTTPELGGFLSGNAFYDGSIAEVLIFDRVLPLPERARLVEYLKARYLIASFP